jgi:HlyD family type I secretion membrane fusion protein
LTTAPPADPQREIELAREALEGGGPAFAGTLVACLAALFLALLGWLAWAQVDEVIQATGVVEPSGRVKLVNHPHGGRVAAIHVHEGQRVATGDVLITLDGEVARSERSSIEGRLRLREVEVARLEAEAADRELPLISAEFRPDLLAAQQALLEARNAAQASRREAMTRAVQARIGELRTVSAEIDRLEGGVALLGKQREAVRELAARGLYPQLKVVQVERQYSDDAGSLAKAKASHGAAEAALAEARSRLEGLETERRSQLLGELAEATADRDRLRDQLRAQEALLAGLEIGAPAAGIVQEVAVAAAGQAVAAQETLMRLVPESEGLVVQARVANRDVGRLRPGLKATVKVRNFDYLRFGSLEGVLQKIAADATADPRTAELAYAVTILIDRDHLGAGPDDLAVSPGMIVDVDLKIGERTILSYLTDRVFRWGEAFREG